MPEVMPVMKMEALVVEWLGHDDQEDQLGVARTAWAMKKRGMGKCIAEYREVC
jgi:hypothetical protein